MSRAGRSARRTLGLALAAMTLTAAVPVIVVVLLVSGGGDAPAPDAADVRALQGQVAFPLYWAGESVAGLPLTGVHRDGRQVNVSYGDCVPAGGEGGCTLPVTIQTTSICDRNPLILDVRPRESRRVRGVMAREYTEGDLSLETGTSNVTVFTRAEYREQVLAALRPAREPAGGDPDADLPAARYPHAYVLELRLVRDTFRRFGNVRAVRDRLGISQSAVRQRLQFGGELRAERLNRPAGQFVREAGCPVEPPS